MKRRPRPDRRPVRWTAVSAGRVSQWCSQPGAWSTAPPRREARGRSDPVRRGRRGVIVSSLDILFLSKEDVDAVDLGLGEAMDAIELGLRAHGEKKVVMPSKDHLALDRSERHWNILKGYVEPIDVAGVKVIGDFEGNYRFGLPSELALITLYRSDTGAPFAILDGTLITWMRTGAVTAVGAKHLAPGPAASARAHRRPRHRLVQRADARPAVRLRGDPRHQQAPRVSGALRRSDVGAAREARRGSRRRSRRRYGTPTSSSTPRAWSRRRSSSRTPGSSRAP